MPTIPTQRLPKEAWLAAAGAVLCLAAMVAGFLAPWMSGGASGHPTPVSRAQLEHSGVAYERHLVQWPAIALPAAAVALGSVVVLSSVGPIKVRTQALASAWLLAATASGGAALAGLRLLGFEVARLLDPGPALVHLQLASYATLAAGVAILALASWQVWVQGPARPTPTAILAAATLLVLPLVPFGTVPGRFAFHYDELTLALAQATAQGPLLGVARDLALARELLAVTALAGVAIALASVWVPPGLRAWLKWAPACLVPLLAGAAFLAVRFQVRWWGLAAVRPGWNYILPIGALGALGLAVAHAVLLARTRSIVAVPKGAPE